MTSHDELRLLPWVGPEGKPCFLSADDHGGFLSRLADNTEAVQLGLGAELVQRAGEVLADRKAPSEELRVLVANLAGALRDALRVAESRGRRLPTQTAPAHEDGEGGPRLPAAAFG
jgi:hypothetical protein